MSAMGSGADLTTRRLVPGTLRAEVGDLAGRPVVVARSEPGPHRGALAEADGLTLAAAADLALAEGLPLVLVLSTSGADIHGGVASLHGWGRAAAAVARCSGVVPVLAALSGPAISGPALLLGMADVVAMTTDAFAFVSGPAMVAAFTGVHVGMRDLGGARVHASASGLSWLTAHDEDHAVALLGEVLRYLPDHADELPPVGDSDDPPRRPVPELRDLVPASPTASYDVRQLVAAVADDGELLELRPAWAPQLVTALAHLGGRPFGVVANQPRALAGTLDIAASQKGAAFVRLCDAFNLPILTVVDTPGFLPGKDLEWRGMIRHGAELAFAYAEATVPRVCLVVRKAYGGAYIVMDSKGMGNDVCLAWPTAEIAVMGAKGAAQILHRNADAAARLQAEQHYEATLLTPWVAAERGFVDDVIDPADTRAALWRAFDQLSTRRERLPHRKHDAGPL